MREITIHQWTGRSSLYMSWIDEFGVRQTKSTKTNDWRKAERIAAAFERDELLGAKKKRMKWDDFRTLITAEFGVEHSSDYRDAVACALNQYESAMRPKLVSDINEQKIAMWRNSLIRRELSESTIASYMRHLQVALKWAQDLGYVSGIPQVKVKRPRRDALLRGGSLTEKEFAQMLLAVPKVVGEVHAPAWRRFLRGMWMSGLRIGEAMRLDFDKLPFRADIRSATPSFVIRSDGQKGRRDTRVPMTPDFATWLKRRTTNQRGLVFPLHVTHTVNASQIVSEIGRVSGVVIGNDSHPTAHDLRRSFGVRWAEKVEAPVLQLLMRHEDIATTMTFYVRLQSDRIGRTLWEKFGAIGAQPQKATQRQVVKRTD